MKTISVALGMVLLLAGQLHAVGLLTLDEALAVALKGHPLTVEATAGVSAAEARTGQSLAAYYPQVTIAADWSTGRSYLTPLERVKSTEVNTEALYLRQTIHDFGRTSGAVAAAREYRTAAAESLATTRQEIAYRVRSAYYLALAAEKQVAATRETVTSREAVFRQAQEFFGQGIRAKADVARAGANLAAARTALIRAENNRDLARVELAEAMGVPSLDGRPLAEPTPSSVPLPDLEASRQEALTARPELREAAALRGAATAALKTARSGHLPILSGTASVGYAARDFPPDGTVWTVGVNLTVPVFSGFSTVEREREASASLRAAEARQETLRLRVGKEVEGAWLGVREAAARIESTEKEVAAATESRDLATARYREGVGNIIEVTDAQSQALDAETARIQAGYDYRAALARLDRALGRDAARSEP